MVAAALDRAGAGTGHGNDAIAELVAGTATAAWCFAEPRPNDRLGAVTLEVGVDGGDVVLNGVKRPVESAARAAHLLVTGRTGSGLTQVLVPAGAPGVSIAPLQTVDLTRRFDVVTFEDVRVPADRVVGEIGGAGADVDHQLRPPTATAATSSPSTPSGSGPGRSSAPTWSRSGRSR